MKAFCPFRRDIIGPAVFEGNILLLLQFLPIFPVGLRIDPTRCALTERIHHPAKRRIRPVLDLDPAIKPTTAIRALTLFRNQPLQPHQAGVPKQVRADFALLERRQVDAVDAARQ
jgi:hypothetical protein